jgi:5-methylcytosine-specific restriction endonuclease McrA
MHDDPTFVLSQIASALTDDDRLRADSLMEMIAFRPGQITPRPSIPVATTAAVFARDHFTCCYCGRRTVPPVVLRCFSLLYPVEFPWHKNWASDVTHPVHWIITSTLEHLEAGSRGGSWTDLDNLACACWECNETKGKAARTGAFASLVEPDRAWDGLTGVYPELWRLAGSPQPKTHRPWLKAWGLWAGDSR